MYRVRHCSGECLDLRDLWGTLTAAWDEDEGQWNSPPDPPQPNTQSMISTFFLYHPASPLWSLSLAGAGRFAGFLPPSFTKVCRFNTSVEADRTKSSTSTEWASYLSHLWVVWRSGMMETGIASKTTTRMHRSTAGDHVCTLWIVPLRARIQFTAFVLVGCEQK